MKVSARAAALAFVILLAATAAHAMGSYDKPVNAGSDGVAIKGYDPVAYFTSGAPTKGSADFTARWMDAEWRFASAANRDLFVADPAKYAPQYGGYCAWAVSQNKLADVDPKQWVIHDGRLFLNYDRGINERFQGKLVDFVNDADRHWPGLKAEIDAKAKN